MQPVWQPPPRSYVCRVEACAERIRDPIKRLRFLRRSMENCKPCRRAPTPWYARAVASVFALLLPANIVSPTVVQASRPVEHRTHRNVWLAEQSAEFELYSNGLRIDDGWRVANRPRHYRAFNRNDSLQWEWRSGPAGIVFHTTEGHLVPFEPLQNRAVLRQSSSLLEYVRNRHLYNFVIDRFGRVYLIVEETDAANHAGNSVWADADSLYVNLNDSFLGVSFEAEGPTINAAQIHAAKVLTEMLRAKYRIRAENCVTHAQVSVNPANLRIGYHTDWAHDFPFAELGLGNNYEEPLPSLCLFGFSYDSAFLNFAGTPLEKGLVLAQEQLRHEAALRGMPVAGDKSFLQRRYRQMSSKEGN